MLRKSSLFPNSRMILLFVVPFSNLENFTVVVVRRNVKKLGLV